MSHADHDLIAADRERMQDNIRSSIRAGTRTLSDFAERMEMDAGMSVLVRAYVMKGNDGLVDEFAALFDAVMDELVEEYSEGDDLSVEARLDAVQRARDAVKELA